MAGTVIVLEAKFDVPTSVEPSADMPEKWADGLTSNAARINDRRIEKVPDSGTFETLIAAPSSTKFQPFVKDNFVSQSGRLAANVKRSQYKNLASSYNQWNDKAALAFATVDGVVAKRFKDQVNNSKDNWADAVAAKTLRITGDGIRGRLASQAVYWLTGDPLANGMTNGVTLIEGGPYNFVVAGLNQQFRAAMMNLITQAGILILDADMLAAELTVQNTRLNALAEAFNAGVIDAFAEPDDPATSYLGFVFNDPIYQLYARLQITT
jgi:hypothetical protein